MCLGIFHEVNSGAVTLNRIKNRGRPRNLGVWKNKSVITQNETCKGLLEAFVYLSFYLGFCKLLNEILSASNQHSLTRTWPLAAGLTRA
jgi:hypothetical protein